MKTKVKQEAVKALRKSSIIPRDDHSDALGKLETQSSLLDERVVLNELGTEKLSPGMKLILKRSDYPDQIL